MSVQESSSSMRLRTVRAPDREGASIGIIRSCRDIAISVLKKGTSLTIPSIFQEVLLSDMIRSYFSM